MQQSDELNLAINAIKKAGQIIKDGYGKTLEILIKENIKSIVTQIDKAAEKTIIEMLQTSSDYPILAEESGKIGNVDKTFWVIDPLDGTTNFSRNIPFFSTSVALVKDDTVVLGVTFNPLSNELFYAEKGKGAYLNGNQINVSTRTEGAIVIINQGIGVKADLKYTQVTEKLSSAFTLRRLGSSCLEYCLVACGGVEKFASYGDKPWDLAAGMLIVQEAGGKVSDWKGNKWSIWNSYALVSNKVIYDKLIQSVDSLQIA
ncbi:inositol monophosphatase [Patescibacteria group bacterium]|nr:inositol monophosphatase [Patescibacteria group bacterium]